MAKKRHTAEQIISKLREAEVLLAKGTKLPQTCRKLGVTEQTYYRWRKEYGGVRTDQVKRFKEMEKENARLKKLVADLSLDNAILKEAAYARFFNEHRPHQGLGNRTVPAAATGPPEELSSETVPDVGTIRWPSCMLRNVTGRGAWGEGNGTRPVQRHRNQNLTLRPDPAPAGVGRLEGAGPWWPHPAPQSRRLQQ